jgi:phosphoglycolate phosphatase
MIGDTAYDMAMALNAGCARSAWIGAITSAELIAAGAHAVAGSVAELAELLHAVN